jgi:hypothetical protein
MAKKLSVKKAKNKNLKIKTRKEAHFLKAPNI